MEAIERGRDRRPDIAARHPVHSHRDILHRLGVSLFAGETRAGLAGLGGVGSGADGVGRGTMSGPSSGISSTMEAWLQVRREAALPALRGYRHLTLRSYCLL